MDSLKALAVIILLALAALCDAGAVFFRVWGALQMRAGRWCKRTSGDWEVPRVGDRVMVVEWHTALPVGSLGRVQAEAINHDTQGFEYCVKVGDRREWIPANAAARMHNQQRED